MFLGVYFHHIRNGRCEIWWLLPTFRTNILPPSSEKALGTFSSVSASKPILRGSYYVPTEHCRISARLHGIITRRVSYISHTVHTASAITTCSNRTKGSWLQKLRLKRGDNGRQTAAERTAVCYQCQEAFRSALGPFTLNRLWL